MFLKLQFTQIQNTIYAVTAHTGRYLHGYWVLVFQAASAAVYGMWCQINLDRFSVMVISVMLYHHTTFNYHLYINYI